MIIGRRVRHRITTYLVMADMIPVQPWGTFGGALKSVRALIPIVEAVRVTRDFTSGTGSETAETNRLEIFFISPFKNIIVNEFAVFITGLLVYVSTTTDTYHYRAYWQLISATPKEAKGVDTSGWDFTPLTDEVMIDDYSRGAASTAGWYYSGRYVQKVWRSIVCPGYLTLRWRTTSWTDGGSVSGHGMRLDNTDMLGALLDAEVL